MKQALVKLQHHKLCGKQVQWIAVLSFAVLTCGFSLAQSGSQPTREAQDKQKPSTGKQSIVQEPDVLRVDTDLTNVFFTAVDSNKRYVTTLRQQDIRVLEDGKEQNIFTFQRETDRPLSLAVLIDVSASQQVTLSDEKSAARSFVDSIVRSGRDEVAVVSFTGDATLEQDLTSNVAQLRRAIDRVEVVLPDGYMGGGLILRSPAPGNNDRAGSTAIWDAIWATSDELLSRASGKKRRAIILITDGFDTSSYLKRQKAVERALQADSTVYVIGIGDSRNFEGVDKKVLRKVAEETGGRAYFPKDEKDLGLAFAEIEQELRSQYLVAYSPQNKAHDGTYHQVAIEITSPELRKEKLHLVYRPGYFAKSSGSPAVSTSRPE
jgi:Ca-activated chloride channel family protein